MAEFKTLTCTGEGVFIWPGVPLVERRGVSFVRASDRDVCNRAGVLHGPAIVGGPLIPALERAGRFVERGQIDMAQTCIAQLQLPPLSSLGQTLVTARQPLARGDFEDDHPRQPAGSPDSEGGRFRTRDGGPLVPDSDKLPPNPTASQLNRFGRVQSMKLKARAMVAGPSRGEVIAEFLASAAPYIIDEAHAVYSRVMSHMDEPVTLDELIARTNSNSPPSWPAYECHHIVEQTPNTGKIPNELLQGRENIVKIPYYIHRDISDYYSTNQKCLGDITPREYLRGKSYEEQYQFGLDVLRDRGVLK